METCGVLDSHVVSGYRCVHRILFEFFHLGQSEQWCSTLLMDDVSTDDVVLHILTTSVSGVLLWVQKATIPTSRADQSDSTTSARTTLVYESHVMVSKLFKCRTWKKVLLFLFCVLQYINGRYSTIWSSLY